MQILGYENGQNTTLYKIASVLLVHLFKDDQKEFD